MVKEGLRYFHLDDGGVRAEMVLRWLEERDELVLRADGRECYGMRLTDEGWEAFGELMPRALAEQDDLWLLEQMDVLAYWRPFEERAGPDGRVSELYYNKRDALVELCLSEFNIAYIRGLSYELLARGETHALVYRAAGAREARAECTSWEGTVVPLEQVVGGHRARHWPPPGDPGAWSLPAGVGCRHSIMAVNGIGRGRAG